FYCYHRNGADTKAFEDHLSHLQWQCECTGVTLKEVSYRSLCIVVMEEALQPFCRHAVVKGPT
nr:hypothetical protein [Tanacetum cinerariifolium]